jgi:dihydroflavonol-4-reductase
MLNRVAITGATGLIGSHLTYALLKKKCKVLALTTQLKHIDKLEQVFSYYNDDFKLYSEYLTVAVGDVLDVWQLEEQFKDIDIVYHCAAVVSFLEKDKAKLVKINGEGTANVVNAALVNNVKQFCHISSVATLNNPDFKTNIDELVHWKSTPEQSQYAISKYMAEREVWRGIEEGLNATIINPSIVLGPIDGMQSSAQLLKAAKKGLKFYTNGSSGFVDVRDVVDKALLLVERQHIAENFVLNGFNMNYKTLFTALNDVYGHQPPTFAVPKWLLKLIAPFTGLFNAMNASIPIVNKAYIATAYDNVSFNANKTERTLSTKFRNPEETFKWLKQLSIRKLH